MSFAAQIRRASLNIGKAHKRTRDAIALELHASTVKDTPRDTNRLAGNWNLTPEAPDLKSDYPSEDSAAIARAVANTAPSKGSDDLYLVNNVPYARYIEEGTDKIPPFAMLRKNLARIQAIVSKKAAQEKARK